MKIQNIPELIFKFILVYLLVCFALSCIISYQNSGNISVERISITNHAEKFLTEPYFIKKGFTLDCSGFTHSVFRKFGLNIPRSSSKQFELGTVSDSIPAKGNLVFFRTNSKKVGHVGISLGNQLFIHSPGNSRDVKIDSLTDIYYSVRYLGAYDISALIE